MRLAQPSVSLGVTARQRRVHVQLPSGQEQEVRSEVSLRKPEPQSFCPGRGPQRDSSRVLDPLPVCQMAAQQTQLCFCSFVSCVTPCHCVKAEERKFLHCFRLLSLILRWRRTDGRTDGHKAASLAQNCLFFPSLEVVYFLSVRISGTEPSLGRIFRTFSDSLYCCIKG